MIEWSDVTACLVTRGNVPMGPVIDPMPRQLAKVVWNNSVDRNLRIWGRYEAAALAETPYVLFQDDDVVFEDYDLLLDEFNKTPELMVAVDGHGGNYGGYEDLAWNGTGAIVSKDLVFQTWMHWFDAHPGSPYDVDPDEDGSLLYECDAVFGILCPHRQVQLPWKRLYADDLTRMCHQPWQELQKARYVAMARTLRDQIFGFESMSDEWVPGA